MFRFITILLFWTPDNRIKTIVEKFNATYIGKNKSRRVG
jgi:hypothetical protein